MIAQLSDYVPLRGDGKHICALALQYVANRADGTLVLEVERHSRTTFADDQRGLTVRTRYVMGTRLGSYGDVVASLTAMHVWDLVELDKLEGQLEVLLAGRVAS